MVCSLGDDEYLKRRKVQTNLSHLEIKKEFEYITDKLIGFLLLKGLDGSVENKKK